MKIRNRFHFVLACAVLLSACSANIPFLKQAPAEPPLGRKDLDAGVALYNAGDYAGAIRELGGSTEIWKADKAIQLDALKYLAFSYCVTNHPVPCRQQFDKALKLDPNFDLLPGERGHPLWQPVFDKAKKGVH